MKTTILLLLAFVLVSCVAVPSSSASCSSPGTTTLLESWPANDLVGIINNSVPSGSVSTASTNWNAALIGQSDCTPIFETGAGFPGTITMNFASIPPPTPCPAGSTCFTRGLTDFTRATFTSTGRLSSVPITINSSMTVTAAITEVVAHELGHTFGLADCNYPGCPTGSSVMEAGAPTTSINGIVGQPGPTPCDMVTVMAFNRAYTCPTRPPPPCTPVVIDTSGQGFFLTSAKNGVVFDISGGGHPVQMGWTAPGANNAFLALPGADGLVHNGQELFGSLTPQPPSSTPNGFAALAIYDDPKNGGNGDGVIDAKDAVFPSLRLWVDANHDGISQSAELYTLPSLGVNSISLNYKSDQRTDQFGNVFRYRAQVNQGEPTNTGRMAYDVFFVSLSPTAKNRIGNPSGFLQISWPPKQASITSVPCN